MYCTCILQEVGLRVENENGLAGFAADRRAPYTQTVTVSSLEVMVPIARYTMYLHV